MTNNTATRNRPMPNTMTHRPTNSQVQTMFETRTPTDHPTFPQTARPNNSQPCTPFASYTPASIIKTLCDCTLPLVLPTSFAFRFPAIKNADRPRNRSAQRKLEKSCFFAVTHLYTASYIVFNFAQNSRFFYTSAACVP